MAITNNNATRIIEFAAASDEQTGKMFVRKIIWAGTIPANSDLKITDSNNKLIWETVQAVANQGCCLDFTAMKRGRAFDGIKIATLDAGKVYVHLA